MSETRLQFLKRKKIDLINNINAHKSYEESQESYSWREHGVGTSYTKRRNSRFNAIQGSHAVKIRENLKAWRVELEKIQTEIDEVFND